MKIIIELLFENKNNKENDIDIESGQQKENASVVVQSLVAKEHSRERNVGNAISREEQCS